MKRKKIRTCFISAPYGTRLESLKSILREKKIQPTVLSGTPSQARSLKEQVLSAIKKSDLFIAVLETNKSNSNIYFELGLAYVLNKETFILASPKLKDLPSNLMGSFYIRSEVDNLEAISFAIDNLVASPRRKLQKELKPFQVSKPVKTKSKALVMELNALGKKPNEADLINILLAAIKETGITVYAHSTRSEIGADIALWADELSPAFTNPFLIEVKKKLTTKAQINGLRDEVVRYLQRNDTLCILVLYLEARPSLVNELISSYPGILALSIRELLKRLEKKSFAQILWDLRNKKVHGIGP